MQTVLSKGTLEITRVWMKRNKTLESDAINHSNTWCHPAHDDEERISISTAPATTVTVG